MNASEIKGARWDAKLTQKELAKLAGVGRNAIINIENGRKISERSQFLIEKALKGTQNV